MATQADFRIVNFNEHLGNNVGDLKVPAGFGSFNFKGNMSTVKSFVIDNPPVPNEAYLLIQTFDVNDPGHKIRINGVDLPLEDLPSHPAENKWQTGMKKITGTTLKQGVNTIQIIRAAGGDNFLIGDVVVHWRESA